MKLTGFERITTKGQDTDIRTLSSSSLSKLYTTLAKRLNQRMLRLERAGFTSETGGAYSDYQRMLRRFGYKKRIKEKVTIRDKSADELVKIDRDMRAQVRMMQDILAEKTSTVPGWNQIIRKRQEKLADYGISFKSTNEMRDFFKSYEFELISLLYSSEQAVEFVGKNLREGSTMQEILQKLEEFRDRTDRDRSDDVAKALGFSGEAEALKYRYEEV